MTDGRVAIGDSYLDRRVWHYWGQVYGGAVSPLCAETLRTLDLVRETWTLSPSFVSCAACRERLAARVEDLAERCAR